jgi:osmoprotectant transport system ATP-binding protein
MLKMLNRLVELSSGKISINGQDIMTQSAVELRRKIGYVIQQIGLFPHYTVEQNIGLVPSLLKWPASSIRKRTVELLQMVGLPYEQYAKKYPDQLSGGQQQRIGLARALAADPPIILMDEPFGALDPIIRSAIRQEFLQLDALKDKTTILVTHDVTEAVQLADHICLMDKGEVQQLGTAKELLYKPANSFVQQFFNQNRFQLQLMVHTLDNVWPVLTFYELNTQPIPLVFDSSCALWEVLNKVCENSTHTKLFGIRKDGKVQYANIDEAVNQAAFMGSPAYQS